MSVPLVPAIPHPVLLLVPTAPSNHGAQLLLPLQDVSLHITLTYTLIYTHISLVHTLVSLEDLWGCVHPTFCSNKSHFLESKLRVTKEVKTKVNVEHLQQGKALKNQVLKSGTSARGKKATRMDYSVFWFPDLPCWLVTYASAF